MQEAPVCTECGVPRYITSEHVWLNSGVMVQKRQKKTRLAFIECENLDPLYAGIGNLIGQSIEHIVAHVSRRMTFSYIKYLLPQDMVEMVKERAMKMELVIDKVMQIGQIMGFGKPTFAGIRYQGDEADYVTLLLEKPYSLPLFLGNIVGTVEALTEREHGFSCSEIRPGIHEVKVFPAAHPKELRKKMYMDEYRHREGHIHWERCSTCGGPAALSEFRWDQESGIIRSGRTGRRMAFLGPGMLDPLFQEMEREVGEAVPRTVIEAQRRFVKTGFYSVKEFSDVETMRLQLALRGLGSLEEMEVSRRSMSLRVENSALHLMVTGLAQGIYELAFGVDTRVEWEVSEDKDLHIRVTPRD